LPERLAPGEDERIELRTVEQQKCAKCDGTGRYLPPEDL